MEIAFGLVLVVTLVVIGMAVNQASAERRRTALDRLAGALTGDGSVEQGHARGTYRGVALMHRFTRRGAGSGAENWTELSCPLPRGYPITLDVVPHGLGDAAAIAAGDMIDLRVGDDELDHMFRIEAAPAAVVRAMFTFDVCRFFTDGKKVDLKTRDGELVLAVGGWIEDVAQAQALWDVLLQLRDAIREGHRAVDDAHPAMRSGSPFRAELDDTPLRDSQAARLDEIEEIERIRARRFARQADSTGTIVALLFAVGFLIAIAVAVQ